MRTIPFRASLSAAVFAAAVALPLAARADTAPSLHEPHAVTYPVGCVGAACHDAGELTRPLRLRAPGVRGIDTVFPKTSGAGTTGSSLEVGGVACILLGLVGGIAALGVALGTPSTQPASLIVADLGLLVFGGGIALVVAGFVHDVRAGNSQRRVAPSYALMFAPTSAGTGAVFGLTVAF